MVGAVKKIDYVFDRERWGSALIDVIKVDFIGNKYNNV